MLFSIVMPVYNAENTVRSAIESVLGQSFCDFELIAVDDGSTDGSPEILKAYSETDKRVRIISVENRGPANARNVGISAVRGEYVMFLDSDDELVGGALEHLNSLLENDGFSQDLIIFGYAITDTDLNVLNAYRCGTKVIRSDKELGEVLSTLYRGNLLNQVWNKVYKASFLSSAHIRFSDCKYGEDRLFVIDVLSRTCNVTLDSACLYNYRMLSESSLISCFCDNKFEICRHIDEKMRILASGLGAVGEDDAAVYDYMFIKSVISCVVQLFHPSCRLNRREKRAYVKGILSHPSVRRKKSAVSFGIGYFLLILLLRTRNVTLNLFAGRFISFISRKNKKLFIKIKHQNKNAGVAPVQNIKTTFFVSP
jgi:glycosyltransferase involved in cell wall biosynthesis